jgi:hypothetical protein
LEGVLRGAIDAPEASALPLVIVLMTVLSVGWGLGRAARPARLRQRLRWFTGPLKDRRARGIVVAAGVWPPSLVWALLQGDSLAGALWRSAGLAVAIGVLAVSWEWKPSSRWAVRMNRALRVLTILFACAIWLVIIAVEIDYWRDDARGLLWIGPLVWYLVVATRARRARHRRREASVEE